MLVFIYLVFVRLLITWRKLKRSRHRWVWISVHLVNLTHSCVISFPFDVPPLYATRRCSQTSPVWKLNHLIHMTLEMAQGANNTPSHRCKPVFVLNNQSSREPSEVRFGFACGSAFQYRGAVHRPGAKWGCSDSLLLLPPPKMGKARIRCETVKLGLSTKSNLIWTADTLSVAFHLQRMFIFYMNRNMSGVDCHSCAAYYN